MIVCLLFRLEKLFRQKPQKYWIRFLKMEIAEVTVKAEEEKKSAEFEFLEEGEAKIIITEKKNVFYNPVQEFNRDLSIAVISQYSKEQSQINSEKSGENENKPPKGLRILEALSATGLRSIRYAKEISGIREIIANDISLKAVEAIKSNIIQNKVEDIVIPSHEDATMVMYQNRKTKFDVVDLDPYGCPAIFLDGAVQSVKDDGLLLVTATDMAVLCGNSPETCYVKYGAVSLKTKCCHEMALRILLQSIASHASRYGKVITPMLSISVDFYIRVFVKIHTSQKACKRNTCNLGLVFQCTGCESITIQPLGTVINNNYKLPQAPAVDKLCEFCKHKHHVGGPIWTGPLHDKNFVNEILNKVKGEEDNNLKTLKTLDRIVGVLSVASEELDTPLHYELSRLMCLVKSSVPRMVQFRSALLNAGYQVSYSHTNKLSLKTDAPNQFIWDIVRAWVKQNPVKREHLSLDSAGLAILNSESKTVDISFENHPDAVPFSRLRKLKRFQLNPFANWGPGTRATTIIQKRLSRSQRKIKRRKLEPVETEKVKEEKNNITAGTVNIKEEKNNFIAETVKIEEEKKNATVETV